MSNIEISHEDWLAAATALFGTPDKWAFRCPSCGHVATVGDWNAIKVFTGQRAPVECIGRLLREVGRADETYVGDDRRESGLPCDWAAFGLLGTLNEGIAVKLKDGHVTWAFDFAGIK